MKIIKLNETQFHRIFENKEKFDSTPDYLPSQNGPCKIQGPSGELQLAEPLDTDEFAADQTSQSYLGYGFKNTNKMF